jgi:transposase
MKKISYKGGEMAVYRLLSNPLFKVGKVLLRSYVKLIFSLLEERTGLKKGDTVYVQIDFTSERDNFQILMASVLLNGKAIPLYFSMRKYPKKKGQYDQKKMEKAFIEGLKHALSKQYRYVIVADRGFGNKRVIELCESAGFEYIIRAEPNLKIRYGNQEGIMSEVIKEKGKYEIEVISWRKTITLIRNEEKGQVWYLMTSLKEEEPGRIVKSYKDRFRIEKVFQDLKSSGFRLEETKIKGYSRFKRMFFLTCIAYSLMVLQGDSLEQEEGEWKKKLTSVSKKVHSVYQLARRFIEADVEEFNRIIKRLINRLEERLKPGGRGRDCYRVITI